jgi:hypothetical protein
MSRLTPEQIRIRERDALRHMQRGAAELEADTERILREGGPGSRKLAAKARRLAWELRQVIKSEIEGAEER